MRLWDIIRPEIYSAHATAAPPPGRQAIGEAGQVKVSKPGYR